jgi:hypothetical protein
MADTVIGDKTYNEEQLADLVGKGENMDKWQKENTEKSQELAAARAEIDEMGDTLELAKASSGNPKLQGELDKLVEKFENSDGEAPEKGTVEGDKYAAEIKKIADKQDAFLQKQNDDANAERTAKAHQEVTNLIAKNIADAGVEDAEKAELLGDSAYKNAMELAREGKLTPEAIKEYVDKKSKIFVDPAMQAKLKAELQEKTATSEGGGGVQTQTEKAPKSDSKEYKEKVRAIVEKTFGS